ncbi:MAG: ABC transporter permease, partial [Frankiaceae bacterium]
LLAFTVSAAMAGLGGALLSQANGSFDADAFSPLQGLVWFAVVLVAGAESPTAAVGAAALLVFIDYQEGPGTSTFVVGVLAVLLGRMPGGLAGVLRRWPAYVMTTPSRPPQAPRAASRTAADGPQPGRAAFPRPAAMPATPRRLSPHGRALLMRARR